MAAVCRRYVPPKRRFIQDLHGATSQKTAFFIVTAVKISNLIRVYQFGVHIYFTFFLVIVPFSFALYYFNANTNLVGENYNASLFYDIKSAMPAV
jgi:hypothetical protein